MTGVRCLVVAKAPVAGAAKTRLGAEIGMAAAADVAAAALLDTVEVCSATFGAERCVVALTGDLALAARGDEITRALTGWTVVEQEGDTFGDRLARAHLDVAAMGEGAVVQVGMDTPQLTAQLLRGVTAGLADHDAVLGRAEDGGWWAIALRDPSAARVLAEVPSSTPTTGADTWAALVARGLDVVPGPTLRDVDTVADAVAVAAIAPAGRFATSWRAAAPVPATPRRAAR